ncbi:hypothetical protein WBW50_02640 [Escherichia marmotae]|uniref:hypothetical protein n=1 Tax=Escherichia marmotae TaxID=1499973 RepID=UPI003D17F54A
MSSRGRKFAAQPILPPFWIYWSLVAGRWSLVAGRWSLVAGRWSLVWQHRIILFRKSMLFLESA